MATISLDLRKRILAVLDEGNHTYQQVADRFKVSRGFVKKLVGQQRHTGSIEPLHHRAGRKRVIAGKDEERLGALVSKQPDATLEELRERLGIDCNLTTIWRALNRLGQRYKKKTGGSSRAKSPGRGGQTRRLAARGAASGRRKTRLS